MRILVTGHHGYIGCSLVPALLAHDHEVTGLDTYLYDGCTIGPEPPSIPSVRADVRDVTAEQLRGFDAVIHLAGLSNDPLGDLDPDLTYDINHRGTTHLATQARAAGVERFVFSSSCSLYGAQGDAPITESADFLPVTPYGDSKVRAEADLTALAGDDFSPTFLRNATAYGMSARLRGDLVVNNLVGYAVGAGEVRMKSDGTPWRPLVHIDDIAAAMVATVEAPREAVHLEAFNVGRTEENYRISEVAAIVADVVTGSTITFASEAGPDLRNYRVDCDYIRDRLPAFRPTWTVRLGVEQLYDAYLRHGVGLDDLTGPRLSRIAHIRAELSAGHLDPSLRWRSTSEPTLVSPGALHV